MVDSPQCSQRAQSPQEIIAAYGETHLICHAALPCICGGSVADEAYIYGLDPETLEAVIAEWRAWFAMPLNEHMQMQELSGGQQLGLAVLLSLASSAPKIAFVDVFHALDTRIRALLNARLAQENPERIVLLKSGGEL